MADKTILLGDGPQAAVGMGDVYDPALQTGISIDSTVITASIPVSELGLSIDSILSVIAMLSLSDTSQGSDNTKVAKTYFYLTTNPETGDKILDPLGVVVLRDSREDLLPGIRENTEEIPGRHGELDFGAEFKSRTIELHVAKETDLATRQALRRTFAQYLNPMLGEKPLIFAEDLEKTYYVKYAGKIDLNQYIHFVDFTIPFKAANPFIIGTYEKTHTGSGVLTNDGNFETPVVIEIRGPVTNPAVSVGSSTLLYQGSLTSDDVVTIDTEKQTVKFNSGNGLLYYAGGFPVLVPGNTTVVAASAGTTIFRWRDRWI